MAKVVKSTREVLDVEKEVKKVTSKKEKKEDKKVSKEKTKKASKKEKKGIAKFFSEVRGELSKVKWPSKKNMVKYSIATISFVIFFGVFFYVIEAIMALVKAWV